MKLADSFFEKDRWYEVSEEPPGPRGSVYLPRIAKVEHIEQFTENEKLFRIGFEKGDPLDHAPGQFVEVSVFGIGEAPLSIASSPSRDDGFELCVRAVGNVTKALHRLQTGAQIGIRGPFGSAFPVEKMQGRDVLFIAGGLGIIPLRSLIWYVLDNRRDFGKVAILYGCKDPSEFLFRHEMEEWEQRDDVEFLTTVDRGENGWRGNVGVITTLIPKVKIDAPKTMAVVVGPPIMYRFVILDLLARGLVDDQIIMSLERRMKCGLGKCGHCQMNGKYVCLDGPVFSYAEVKNLDEAL
ncbi:MAG: FAD/NAD(P)-binding protein [Armatimonadetes bacterium]|nr:FAD/NAD(P)-binding protein [Armatimonadota bacterium]